MNTLYKKGFAEFLGTFFLVFAGCGALMVQERFADSVPMIAVPLVFGLIVACMIYAVGHISGAHFNPAVTIAFSVARHFPKADIPVYLGAQLLGSALAVSALWFMLPEGEGYGATLPAIGVWKAVAWEFFLSFALMFVIMAVATDTRAVGVMAGAAIGGTVMLCAFVGGPVTGASMNPARSFGPALFEGTVSVYWIYLLGPILGTIAAATVYEWIRCDSRITDKRRAAGCC